MSILNVTNLLDRMDTKTKTLFQNWFVYCFVFPHDIHVRMVTLKCFTLFQGWCRIHCCVSSKILMMHWYGVLYWFWQVLIVDNLMQYLMQLSPQWTLHCFKTKPKWLASMDTRRKMEKACWSRHVDQTQSGREITLFSVTVSVVNCYN